MIVDCRYCAWSINIVLYDLDNFFAIRIEYAIYCILKQLKFNVFC